MIPKPDLRKQAREIRATLYSPNFAARVAAFADDLQIAPHAIVAGYWPVRGEADPRLLMKALARPLALPRIAAKGAALSFRRWNEGDALVDNHHAIAEPRADAEIVTPDVILVPLLAFDARGHRLGYGGGYYDRTLASLSARAIGVAYSGQEIDTVGAEAHDCALDGIITERGVRYFGGTP